MSVNSPSQPFSHCWPYPALDLSWPRYMACTAHKDIVQRISLVSTRIPPWSWPLGPSDCCHWLLSSADVPSFCSLSLWLLSRTSPLRPARISADILSVAYSSDLPRELLSPC